MKIYFAGSIRGGRDDQKEYNEIIKYISGFGLVLTEHIGDKLSEFGEDKKDTYIFERDVDWVKEADILIAEVTTPSVGVGYEIGLAESLNKRIICVYNTFKRDENRISAMIQGNKKLEIIKYSSMDILKDELSKKLA